MKKSLLLSILFASYFIGCNNPDTSSERIVAIEKHYKELNPLGNGLAIVANRDYKLGLIDSNANEIIPCLYHAFGELREDMMLIEKDKLMGCVNSQGKIILPCEYQKIYLAPCDLPTIYKGDVPPSPCGGRFPKHLLMVQKNQAWAYMDSLGKVVIPFDFDSIGMPEIQLGKRHYIRVWKNKKMGLWDLDGKEVLACKYDRIERVQTYQLRTFENGKEGLFNLIATKSIPSKYEKITLLSNKYSAAKLKGKWGCMDKNDKVLIPFVYDSLVYYEESKIFVGKKTGKWGLISEKGKIILPCKYELLQSIESTGKYWAASTTNKGKLALMRQEGKWLSNEKYQQIRVLGSGVFEARENNLITLINSSGKVLITPTKYNADNIRYLEQNKTIVVKLNQKWGLIGINGEKYIDFLYDAIDISLDNQYYIASKNGKWGFLDKMGNVVTPFVYDDIPMQTYTYYTASINGKIGLCDAKGKMLIPFQYEKDGFFYHGKDEVSISKNGKWGIMDINQKEIVPCVYESNNKSMEYLALLKISQRHNTKLPKYDSLSYLSLSINESYYSVLKNKKWGLYDSAFNEIMPCRYDKIIKTDTSQYASVVNEGKMGLISLANHTWKEIYPCIYTNIGLLNNNHNILYTSDEYNHNSFILLPTKKSIISGKNLGFFTETADYLILQQENKYGIINKKGELCLPLRKNCNRFNMLTKNKMVFCCEDKWYIINLSI